jgi:phosphoribosylanthranilate isomerase
MKPTLRPRVKICCIADAEEADLAVAAGAAALGLVSWMPSGPGVVPDETIAAVARHAPPAVATFLLTSRQDVASIAALHRAVRTSTIQLVDQLVMGTHAELREALPGIKLVQVIHVTGPDAVDDALELAEEVDALLLDSGNPRLAVKELGGTGRRHDWRLSREIRERAPVPVFLAGGLASHNVREAIEAVGAYGLDVCSGTRTEGRLDPRKLEAFMREVERAG